MSKKKDARLVYAQSSDIKARTYIEYRKDMKKKAIEELETKEWLENKLKEELKTRDIAVQKHGADKFLWFLREGRITRDPDFVVRTKEEGTLFVELQYADREDLRFFDFKISKVAKKTKNARVPYKDRIFLFVLKSSSRYAFITPEWIAEHGEIDVVHAWGSRKAYRVPKKELEKILKEDRYLPQLIKIIDAKITILEFQHHLISIWEDKLSEELQRAVDEKKLVKIIPKSLEGFFKVCFILDHLNRIPEKNMRLWLVYLLSYVNKELPLRDVAMLTYSLDFLYTKIPPRQIESNELSEIEEKINKLINLINSYYNHKKGVYQSSINESPLEETRFALFSINLLEDLIQDSIYYYNAKLKPITKIYQNVKQPIKIAKIIASQ